MNIKRSIGILMTAGLATNVTADILVFQNDNPDYHLGGYGGCSFSCGDYQSLDITLDSWSQPSPQSFLTPPQENAIAYWSTLAGPSPTTTQYGVCTAGNVQVAVGAGVLLYNDELDDFSVFIPLEAQLSGGVVDNSYDFEDIGLLYMFSETESFVVFAPDQPFIVPIQLALADGIHYGFIEMRREDPLFVHKWQPTRWGYETLPDTPFVIPSACLADLALPFGELNFFDVSAFLSAFTSHSYAADINNDGEFNFFDVSEFLNIFTSGCP